MGSSAENDLSFDSPGSEEVERLTAENQQLKEQLGNADTLVPKRQSASENDESAVERSSPRSDSGPETSKLAKIMSHMEEQKSRAIQEERRFQELTVKQQNEKWEREIRVKDHE